MLILCVDTSNKVLDITLSSMKGDICEIATSSFDVCGRMNESFIDCIDSFFSEVSISPSTIDQWIAITGPGSFTGVRIGIAALSGLCVGYKKDLAGISALDACALVSGKSAISVGARLKLNEYACKDYNFEKGSFSNIYMKYSVDGLTLVNSGNISVPPLTKAVLHPGYLHFLKSADPIYVRKSEAELNFDKKSHNR